MNCFTPPKISDEEMPCCPQYCRSTALDGTLVRESRGWYWRNGGTATGVVDLLNGERFDFRILMDSDREVVEFPEFICWEPDSWPGLSEHGTLPCRDPFAVYQFHWLYPEYRDRPLGAWQFGRETFEIWALNIFGPTWPPEQTERILKKARSLGARIPENGFRVHHAVGTKDRRKFERRRRHSHRSGSAPSTFHELRP